MPSRRVALIQSAFSLRAPARILHALPSRDAARARRARQLKRFRARLAATVTRVGEALVVRRVELGIV